MYGVALHLLLDKDEKRVSAEIGYYRNCAYTQEMDRNESRGPEYIDKAWKTVEHRSK